MALAIVSKARTGLYLSLLAGTLLGAPLCAQEPAGPADSPSSQGTEPAPQAHHRTHSLGRIRAWEKELRAIADLLIDGHYLEGRDRAARILKQDPTPEIAERAKELLGKADLKLAQAGTPAPGVSAEGSPIVIRPSQGTATLSGAAPRKRFERAFEVQLAKDDRGFAGGTSGQLTISEDGVVFTPKGEERPEWAIAWKDLTSAHRAEGLWEVPYPLALVEKSGRVHHLVVIDAKGTPQPGNPVLTALAEGRLASHKGYG
jgi:hypothetical protein